MIKSHFLCFILLIGISNKLFCYSIDSVFSSPVRGLCIKAPNHDEINNFVEFISQELAPRSINTLILRIDYSYEFKSRPELVDEGALSESDVNKIVTVCKENDINLIPQINLFGHQSWAGSLGKLLEVYPQFDETPDVELPDDYEWPNEDGLYCKSYCPLHPEVHDVVFDLVDEICEAFESDAFHAGMDEVFYISEEQCTRCNGTDPAEIYAAEITKIRNHLKLKKRRLWIWGDRLIDGKITGLGEWEASMNNTARAIDMIPKDVVICDWHYNKPVSTPVYFSMKGFNVISCPWKKSSVGIGQQEDMDHFRASATLEMKSRYAGVMQTVWTSASKFIEGLKSINPNTSDLEAENSWTCFYNLFPNKKD